MDNQSSTAFRELSRAAHSAAASASLTYEPFFGLSEKPFSLSADPRFLFKGPAHAPAFEALLGGIRRREGLIVLTGEIGSGKTTLCRSVLQHLDRRTFAAFVPDPFVSREDLLKTLLVDFGVVSISDLKAGRLKGTSRPDLSYPLYEFLDSLVPLQAFAVLIIDEAQNLTLPLLEEIRILSELEQREKLLQVVLVGQPELRANLKLPQMRQVDQRVSIRHELTALDASNTAAYVHHRLHVAGGGESRVEFTTAALAAVYQGSSGVPRLINRICDRALQRAYASEAFRVDPKFVWEAIDDLDLLPVSGAGDEAARPEATSIVSPERSSVGAPAPRPPAISTPGDDGGSGSPEFAAESKSRVARPALIFRPLTRWPWGLAAALLFAIAAAAGGAVWYLGVRSVDGAAMAAMVPPLPPRTFLPQELPRLPDEAVSAAVPGPAGLAAGAAPAAGEDYLIQVASFTSRERAQRLVAELTSAGYRAREVERDFGPPRGRLLQVIVGGYSSALEVERDLRRIRELPEYGDARLIAR